MNRKSLAVLMVFMLFSAFPVAMIGSYGDTTITGGYTECDTSLQILSLFNGAHGGTVHWHITGEQAKELRKLIIERLDNVTIDGIPPEGKDGHYREKGKIDKYEANVYVGSATSFLQHYIEGGTIPYYKNDTTLLTGNPNYMYRNGTGIKYYGIEIKHSDLSGHNVEGDTNGLIGTDDSYTSPIDIYMTINMNNVTISSQITMSNTNLLTAPFECLKKYNESGKITDDVIYRGDGVVNHLNIVIGLDSYSYPKLQKGSMWMIRTPAGEIFSYSVDVSAGGAGDDYIHHSSFDPLENPQILFIIVAIFGYLSVAFPTHFFLEYRNAYPKRYRLEARKIKWIHWTGRIFLLILIIFYFFPVVGPLYFSGPIMIALSIIFVLISAGISKVGYEKAIENIPKEYFEKKDKKRVKKTPAMPAMTPIPEEYEEEPVAIYGEEEEEERIHCINCGSVIKIKEGENLLKVRCPVCGALQKRVEQGYNHLILDSELKNTYNMLADFLKDGYLALCMSTMFPDKLKRTYNLSGKLKCIWLTNAGGKDTIDPSNIEKIAEVVERFSEKYPASVILFDGLEYLVVEHGFDEAMKLIKKITDTASMMDMTLIVPVNPAALTTDELSKLRAEFDRVEALEDRDERTFY